MKAGFLNLGAVDILGWIIQSWTLSCASYPWPLPWAARSTSPESGRPMKSPDIVRCPFRGKVTPVLNHCIKGCSSDWMVESLKQFMESLYSKNWKNRLWLTWNPPWNWGKDVVACGSSLLYVALWCHWMVTFSPSALASVVWQGMKQSEVTWTRKRFVFLTQGQHPQYGG